ncbi:hypothetical protein [Streptomyces synnematoformans]|uniref:DUF2493 domain-containing protein n=1 Tax=Streptomyces synnematoformans TaxID=415721 RepID=A0ABN2XBF9_9ACTN
MGISAAPVARWNSDKKTLILGGSRHYTDRDRIWQKLHGQVRYEGPFVLRHGSCPGGADEHAHAWCAAYAASLGVIEDPRPADWDNCGPECPPPGTRPHRRRKKPGDIFHPGSLDTYCPGAGPRRNVGMVAEGADAALLFFEPGARNLGTKNLRRLAHDAGIPVIAHGPWGVSIS